MFLRGFAILNQKIAKWLSILVAYIIAIGAFAILIIFVAPQIYTSITDISVQFPIWFESAQQFILLNWNKITLIGQSSLIMTKLTTIFNRL